MASIPTPPLGRGAFVWPRFVAVTARLRAWNDARVTRAALSRLSNHELDDLGLTRGDLDAMARGDAPLR